MPTFTSNDIVLGGINTSGGIRDVNLNGATRLAGVDAAATKKKIENYSLSKIVYGAKTDIDNAKRILGDERYIYIQTDISGFKMPTFTSNAIILGGEGTGGGIGHVNLNGAIRLWGNNADLTEMRIREYAHTPDISNGNWGMINRAPASMCVDITNDTTGAKVNIPQGTKLQIYSSSGDYYDCYYPGTNGVKVLKAYLTPTTAPVTPPVPGETDSALEKAILLTASFEGSGYVNVTGNFDGAGLSIGIFQWNIGQGTLQPMLKQFFDNNPDLAKQIFGGNYQSVVNMLGSSKSAQMEWARSINNGKKLKTEWYNQFVALCETSQFQQIQRGAMKEYTNQAYRIANDYDLKTERGLALALDIAVQNWDVSSTSRANIRNSMKNGIGEQEILQLLAQAAVDKAASAYKADVSSRKFTIVNGTGTVHGKKYNIEKEYGITNATFR